MVPVPEVRHRQTDRQSLYCGNTALCIASRGKKKSLYHIMNSNSSYVHCRPTYHELWTKY